MWLHIFYSCFILMSIRLVVTIVYIQYDAFVLEKLLPVSSHD